jgi:hypothetical protein
MVEHPAAERDMRISVRVRQEARRERDEEQPDRRRGEPRQGALQVEEAGRRLCSDMPAATLGGGACKTVK